MAAAVTAAAAALQAANRAGPTRWNAAVRLTRAAWARIPAATASKTGCALATGRAAASGAPMTGLAHIAVSQSVRRRPDADISRVPAARPSASACPASATATAADESCAFQQPVHRQRASRYRTLGRLSPGLARAPPADQEPGRCERRRDGRRGTPRRERRLAGGRPRVR